MDGYIASMKKYARFGGRATRSEYWQFTFIISLMFIGCVYYGKELAATFNPRADSALPELLIFVIVCIHLIPALAVQVRRLHDTDTSGWMVLAGVIPFGIFVLFVFACIRGTEGPNRFGPDPLEAHYRRRYPALPNIDVANPPAPTQSQHPVQAADDIPSLKPMLNAEQSGAPRGSDHIAELERLAQLRAAGHLSEAEFAMLKARALGTANLH